MCSWLVICHLGVIPFPVMQIQIVHKLGNYYWRMKDNEVIRERLTCIQVEISKPTIDPNMPWLSRRTKQEIFLGFEDDDETLFSAKYVFKTKKALLDSL